MAGYARKSHKKPTPPESRRAEADGYCTHRNLRPDVLACVHRSYTGGKRLHGGSSHRPYRVLYAFLKANCNPLISQFAAFHHNTVELSAIIAGFPN